MYLLVSTFTKDSVELLGITIRIDSNNKSSSKIISLSEPLIEKEELTQLFSKLVCVNLPVPPSTSFATEVSSTNKSAVISSTLTCSKNL